MQTQRTWAERPCAFCATPTSSDSMYLSVSFKNRYISCKINDMLLLETLVSKELLRILQHHIVVPFYKLNLRNIFIFTL